MPGAAKEQNNPTVSKQIGASANGQTLPKDVETNGAGADSLNQLNVPPLSPSFTSKYGFCDKAFKQDELDKAASERHFPTSSGQFSAAINCANRIKEPGQRFFAQIHAARTLAEVGQDSLALKMCDAAETTRKQEITAENPRRYEKLRLAEARAAAGDYSAVEKMTRQEPYPSFRAKWFTICAEHAVARGRDSVATKMFDAAKKSLSDEYDPGDRSKSQTELAERLSKAGRRREATEMFAAAEKRALESVKQGWESFPEHALNELAKGLANTGDYFEAKRVCSQIKDHSWRYDAQLHTAVRMSKAGLNSSEMFNAAVKTYARFGTQSGEYEAADRIELAVKLYEAGQDSSKVSEEFAVAEKCISSIEHSYYRNKARANLAKSLATCGRFEAAKEIASKMASDPSDLHDFLPEALSHIAVNMADAGLDASEIYIAANSGRGSSDIAQSMAKHNDPDGAARMARTLKYAGDRAQCQVKLALIIAEKGGDPTEMFAEARENAFLSTWKDNQDDALCALGQALLKVGKNKDAAFVTSKINNLRARSRAQANLAKQLAE